MTFAKKLHFCTNDYAEVQADLSVRASTGAINKAAAIKLDTLLVVNMLTDKYMVPWVLHHYAEEIKAGFLNLQVKIQNRLQDKLCGKCSSRSRQQPAGHLQQTNTSSQLMVLLNYLAKPEVSQEWIKSKCLISGLENNNKRKGGTSF